MDQVYNNMLNAVQTMAGRPAGKSQQPQEKDGFQKLMNQKQNTGKSDKAETAVQDQPQAGQPVEAEDPKELEEQMALAAMAVAQNPAIAQLIEETPEVLSDPSWEDGLVPVDWDDHGDLRIVHWVRPEAGVEQELEVANDEAANWMEEQTAQTAESATASPAANVDDGAPEVAGAAVEKGVDSAEQESDSADTPEEGIAEAPVFRDVREIPVKVGEAPAAEEPREVPVEDQIGPKLTEALKAGDTRVEIQLAPENLGKVTVEVTLHEDGALHVALHAENSQTRGLLERSADSLMAMLGREARQEVQVEVPRQQESQQQNFYDGQQGHERQGRQQQQQRQERQGGEDFLHQLRLGLVPGDGE